MTTIAFVAWLLYFLGGTYLWIEQELHDPKASRAARTYLAVLWPLLATMILALRLRYVIWPPKKVTYDR
jgi:hypothetical protein